MDKFNTALWNIPKFEFRGFLPDFGVKIFINIYTYSNSLYPDQKAPVVFLPYFPFILFEAFVVTIS